MLSTVPVPDLRPLSGLRFLYSSYFNLVVLAGVVLITLYWSGRHALYDNQHVDLYIYSSGAQFALQGSNPYDVEQMHARVDELWPDDENLDGNNGFFLAPQALLVLVPFALLPWTAAKVVWCLCMTAMLSAVSFALASLTRQKMPLWFPGLAMILLVSNPMTFFILIVGQTTIFFLACVVLGQWFFNRGCATVGSLLWALAFFKPHIAMALVPVCWFVHGWRSTLMMLTFVGVLNIAAGLVFFGNPLFILDYINSVSAAHKTVLFNRVEVNKQISSWNRLIVAGGGPVFELGMVGTFAGYAVFLAVVALRLWWAKTQLTLSWAFALAGVGAVSCCQLLPYEQALHILILPYLVMLALTPRWQHRAAALGLFLAWQYSLIPGGEDCDYYRFVSGFSRPFDDWWLSTTGYTAHLTDVLYSHRSLGSLALALGVVAVGPVQWHSSKHDDEQSPVIVG